MTLLLGRREFLTLGTAAVVATGCGPADVFFEDPSKISPEDTGDSVGDSDTGYSPVSEQRFSGVSAGANGDYAAVTSLVAGGDSAVLNLATGARIPINFTGQNLNALASLQRTDGTRVTLAAAQKELVHISPAGVKLTDASVLAGANFVSGVVAHGGQFLVTAGSATLGSDGLMRFTNGALHLVGATDTGLTLEDLFATSGVNPTGILPFDDDRVLVLSSGDFTGQSLPTLDIININGELKTNIGTLPSGHTFQLGSEIAFDGEYVYLGTADNSGLIARVSLTYPYEVKTLILPRSGNYTMHSSVHILNGNLFIADQESGKILVLPVSRFDAATAQNEPLSSREVTSYDGASLLDASRFYAGMGAVVSGQYRATFHNPETGETFLIPLGG